MDTPESKEQVLQKAKHYFEDNDRDLLLSPPLKRAAYSDRMAWVLASMSQLAYDHFEAGGDERETFIEKLKSGGFELLDEFNHAESSTQAFLALNTRNQYVVLAFRGSQEKHDFLVDATLGKVSAMDASTGHHKAFRKAYQDINAKVNIHKGFMESYNKVQAKIEKSLTEKLSGMPLYVTGHSLGAALATVATFSLEDNKVFRDHIAACYTFGSPRVGDDQLNLNFKSAIYRVVNTTDIVTVVPLLLMGYTHVGDDRFLLSTPGQIRRGVPVLSRTGLFLLGILFKLFIPLVGDHGIGKYRAKLEAVARERNQVDKRMGR